MADNIAVSQGTGTTIATDQVGAVHFQKVKLVDGTTDSSDVISGDSVNGLDVDITRSALPTGAATSAKQDTGNTSLDNIDDKLPALGQALAAASVPVILPTATITTLTPPAAITGFATAAKQLEDGHNVTVDNSTGAAAVNVQDGGNSLTVDGTVAVTHAALTELGSAINSDKVDVNIASGNPTTITATQATASNLKTAATLDAETTKVIGTINVAASQTIGVTQATAGNLNCTEASASAIKTAVEVIDNMISGSEAQVDVVAALPTGTNIIGAVKRDVINYTGINKYYSYTGAVTDGIVWSPASGKQVVITDLAMSLSAAGTVTLEWDKTGGDEAIMAFDLAANGGVSMNLQTPITSSQADADLIITTSAGNIKIMVTGYEI